MDCIFIIKGNIIIVGILLEKTYSIMALWALSYTTRSWHGAMYCTPIWNSMIYLEQYDQKVFLKIKGSQNLIPQFYEPYKILQCIGPPTYKLALLASSKVYLVFHVSYLKKVLDSHTMIHIELAKFTDDGSIIVKTDVVLDCHTCQLHNCTIIEVLIQQHKLALKDTTCEYFNLFQQQFSNFQL